VFFEDASCPFELFVRLLRAALLPPAACQHESVARSLELFTRLVEPWNALRQHRFRSGRPAVHPEHSPHAAEKTRADERIADMRQGAIEKLERLAKCE